MASTVTVSGTSYSVPAEGDSSWGSDLTNLLIRLSDSSKVLQNTSTTFTLQNELNLGATYGLKLSYLKSQAANPASAGIVRLGNAESIKWRNQANNADLDLTVNASNVLQFNGSSILLPGIGSIVDADINASAAIAYSKLNLTGNIVNADISNSAAIAYSKLNLSTSIVNADISASAAIAYSKLNLSGSILNADINASAAIAYSKLNLSNSILDADINSSAAIALSKLAALSTGKALQSNASTGVIEASSVTNTELSRLSGIGSSAVGISDTQILTNKDIDGGTAANTRRLTLPKDTLSNLTSLTRKQGTLVFDTTSNKPYYDDGSNLRVIGSGSGAGGNLIDDGDAEAGTSNYVEGSYSAATRPSGTFTSSSGSGAFAISTSTSSPLSGNNSFVLTKSSGASRQGRVVERTINLDLENRAKVLEVRIKYIVNSGSFVAGSNSSDSSLIWYIGQYDGSTWTYTEPSSFKMLSSSTSISDVLIGNFQTNYDTTQVKLIAYVAESADSAWEVKCEVAVQPCNYVYGTPITDWVAYIPTGSWVTNTTYTGKWRRVGDTLESQITLVLAGAPTAADLTVNFLPSGLSVDTGKMSAYSFGSVGDANIIDSGTRVYVANAAYNGGSSVYIVHTESGNTGLINATNPTTFASGDNIRMNLKVPISGWSSNVQMSDSYSGRDVVLAASKTVDSAAFAAATDTAIAFTNVLKDSTNSWNGTDTFTVPSFGDYRVSVNLYWGTGVSTTSTQGKVFVDGVVYTIPSVVVCSASSTSSNSFSLTIPNLRAGQTIKIYGWVNAGSTSIIYGNANKTSTLNIEKLSSSATTSATEKVFANYYSGSSQSIPNSTATTVNYATKISDSHNAVTVGASWKFTAPVEGQYIVSAHNILNTGGGWVASEEAQLSVYKNGGSHARIASNYAQAAHSTYVGLNASTRMVQLNAGEYISIVAYQNSGGALDLIGSQDYFWVNIYKL